VTYGFNDWQAGRPLPKGFDVADAVRDGWTADHITQFMRATVRPWSPEPDGGGQGPKSEPAPEPEPEPEPRPEPAPKPEPARPAPAARSYDEVMAEAQTLGPDDVEGLERVLADAATLPAVRQDAILRVLKSATGIGANTLKKQMKESLGDDDQKGVDHLELARRSVRLIGADNIICVTPFVWMWSDKGVWKQQEDRLIKQKVQRTIEMEALPVTSTLVNGVSEVLKNEIFREDHEFNLGHPETINARNGQIVPDGDGWRLEQHCKEHYRTTQIPVEFDPSAKAPRWSQFLVEIFQGDDDCADKAAALMEMMGYTLMSHARHELFALMIGSGGNGKSVVLSVIEALCGSENVAGVQPSNFDRSFQRAHLDQKLANIVTEIKQGEVIADAELKGIVSGEKSTVEHKFQDPFDMHPFATCWFGTNHMPHTRDFSDALFRRALILTFNRQFTDAEKDPLLKETLLAELPGILNMALAFYRRAATRGFTKPASSIEAAHEWRLEADQVAMFVEDCCVRKEGHKELSGDLFAKYQEWAGKNGVKQTMSAKGLRDRLTKLGFGKYRDYYGRYVTGIQISSGGGEDGSGW
jgi:putative DNA primase/helicase